jgi:3-oxoacyl-[acyl-carrier-protein] synthase II
VAITGIGAITPLGGTANALWEGLVSGRSGISPISGWDASRHKVKIAG